MPASGSVSSMLKYNHVCGLCDTTASAYFCSSDNNASQSTIVESCDPCLDGIVFNLEDPENLDTCEPIIEKGLPYGEDESGQSYVGYHQGQMGCTYNAGDETDAFEPCGFGEVRNCELECQTVDNLDNGTCDPGFDCERFNFDASDCLESPNESVCGPGFLEAVKNCDGRLWARRRAEDPRLLRARLCVPSAKLRRGCVRRDCGDGECQETENHTDCPADCPAPGSVAICTATKGKGKIALTAQRTA